VAGCLLVSPRIGGSLSVDCSAALEGRADDERAAEEDERQPNPNERSSTTCGGGPSRRTMIRVSSRAVYARR
jgi:hypothetical protein